MGSPIKIRIGANESCVRSLAPKPSPAINAGAPRVSWYCDPEGFELREALAKHHGVARENIGLGVGADDILSLAVRSVTIDPGDRVAMSLGAYPTFAFHVNGFGGKFVTPPYRDFKNDAAALADAAAKAKRAYGLSLQSRQPHGKLDRRRGAAGARPASSRRAWCWCSTRLIPAISRRRVACRRSIPRTSASSASGLSRKRMAWPVRVSAMPSRPKRSSPASTRSGIISVSRASARKRRSRLARRSGIHRRCRASGERRPPRLHRARRKPRP